MVRAEGEVQDTQSLQIAEQLPQAQLGRGFQALVGKAQKRA
jgi:hypothetical protein